MANKVYTESVVTLNGEQADATMRALEDRADSLRKKMIEATKLGDTSGATKFRKELDAVNKSMAGIKKDTKDYSAMLNNLNGQSLNQLSKIYKGLNQQIKNLTPGTKEFIEKSEQLKKVKERMSEVQGMTRNTQKTLGGFWSKIGWTALAAGAMQVFRRFGEDVINTTQLMGDKWGLFTSGMKQAYGTFIADLSSGKGWKELIANMRESYQVGREVQAILDEIFERKNSLTLIESEYNVEIEKNKQIMRDQTRTDAERLAAAEEAIRLERELAQTKKEIAKQENDAHKLALQDRTKLTDAELEFFIVQYNQNKDIIRQAQEYNALLASKNRALKYAEMAARDSEAEEWMADSISKLKKEISELQSNTSDGVKQVADLVTRYDLGNDELVDNYVKSRAAMSNADADFYRTTTRIATTVSTLKKEMAAEDAEATKKAYEAAIKASEKKYKEYENIAKKAYVDGEISESEYQSRIATIQENALKDRIAITEKYKLDTTEYLSKLYDLTVQQKKKIQDIFDQAEKEVAQGLSDMIKTEMDQINQEIESMLEDEMNDFIDKWNQMSEDAQKIKAALNPVKALEDERDAELKYLDELYKNNLLKEEDYQKARTKCVKHYQKEILAAQMEPYKEGFEVASDILGQMATAVSTIQEAHLASLDAQMQKELAAAGDNAEKRAEIEAKYEAQKLEVQKKYANVEMGISIAQALAAGALAVMQSLAQLGPIAGGIMAGVIAATTAAQVALIVAQRNAIMNSSVSSSGSGSSPDVGQRTPTGYSEGGFTENRSNDYEPVGIVHANEWVASAAMVRAMPVTFARLEAVRRSGNYKSGITGFADGGFVSESKGPAPVQQTGLNLEGLNAAIDKFASTVERPIRAYTLLSDVNAAQELDSKLKKITSKS